MNKKGVTLVEIIISIVLISIVLIFLFSLLVTVNDMNDESEVNSTYLVNKALILKNIESDLEKALTVSISSCNINDPGFYTKYGDGIGYFSKEDGVKKLELTASRCLKFDYTFSDPAKNGSAYLGIYYYKNKNSYVISYIHDSIKATRLLPDFELNNVILKDIDSNGTNDKAELKEWEDNTNKDVLGYLTGFNVINIPIIGNDGKDYGINISYYK